MAVAAGRLQGGACQLDSVHCQRHRRAVSERRAVSSESETVMTHTSGAKRREPSADTLRLAQSATNDLTLFRQTREAQV